MASGGRLTSKLIDDLLNTSAENEELDLPSGNFVATTSRGYKILFLLVGIICVLTGIVLLNLVEEVWLSGIAIALGLVSLLYLPTCLSYKGYISSETMREEYLIVFFKVIKEVEWKDIKYKKIKRNEYNEVESIKFYDENMKRLMSFDKATVGFTRIVKMAKKGSIKEIK